MRRCCFYEIRTWVVKTFSSIQLFSHVQLFATPYTAAHQAFLSITNTWSLLKLMSIESVMPSNHLILCRPISPSNEYSGLISFRMDWFYFLAVQGTPTPQFKGWNQFFGVQLSLWSTQHCSPKRLRFFSAATVVR